MAFVLWFQLCMLFVQTFLVSVLVAKAWMEDNILHSELQRRS